MNDVSIKHTADIFERLFDRVGPVLPDPLRAEFAHALEHMRHDGELTLEEVEDTLIIFGKKVWPYRKAFEEFVSTEAGDREEKIFLAKLPLSLKKRFKVFEHEGGSLRDLHSGIGTGFFKPDERISFCTLLIEVKNEIRATAVQAIKSTEAGRFEARVAEFQNIFSRIEATLHHLERMADEEQEHPHLASEIRAQIRGFEHGLCFLGPEADVGAICLAPEYFGGRKREIKVRG